MKFRFWAFLIYAAAVVAIQWSAQAESTLLHVLWIVAAAIFLYHGTNEMIRDK